MFELPSETSVREILPFAIILLFGLALVIQLLYYWILYSRLAFYRPKEKHPEQPPVSVVICAKNEYHNLMNNLSKVLEQDYPNFEVVVVNDSSDDGTMELLTSMSRKYPHLHVFDLERNLNFFTGKKFPLSLGIKSARYELILLTDADCRPASTEWIRNMQSRMGKGNEIILGYGPYEKKGGLLNFLIRYDTFVSGMQYFSFALAGMPYMGVGRNLMYSRELFYKTKGFVSHYRLSSGDDDLFINTAARKGNTAIEIDPSSHVYSIAKSNLPQWLYQKKRHYTTAKYYRPKYKYLLSVSYLSKFLSYGLLPVLLIWNYNPLFVAGAFVFYYLNHLVIMHLCANKLNERDLIWFSPVFEVVMLVISPLLYFTNILVRPEKWK